LSFVTYFHGALTGILLTVVAHVIFMSTFEINVKSRAAEKCITSGGEIIKVRAGGQVICRTRK
jgi:hypothetical protein